MAPRSVSLDGNHDEAELVDELVDWLTNTEVAIHREGRAIAHEAMQSAIKKFAKSSLLQP